MTFTAVLTQEQVQDIDRSMSALQQGVGTWRLALLMVLSKNQDELMRAAAHEENAEAMLSVLEATRDMIAKHQGAIELMRAAESRLRLVLKDTYGPP